MANHSVETSCVTLASVNEPVQAEADPAAKANAIAKPKPKAGASKRRKPVFGRKLGIDSDRRLDWFQLETHGSALVAQSEVPAPQKSARDDARKQRSLQLPSRVLRALDAGIQIKAARPDGNDILFVPAVFALLGFPITGDQVPYIQRAGRSHLKISPNAAAPCVELPSGSVALLTLISLATVAVRQGSAVVKYDDVLLEYVAIAGEAMAPEEPSRLTSMLSRLADCTFSYDVFGHRFSGKIFQLSYRVPPTQEGVSDACVESITIDPTFHAQVSARAVALDRRAVAALSAAPLALRIYMWLTQIVSKLSSPKKHLAWSYLFGGLGAGYSGVHAQKNFKRGLLVSLVDVLTVYPSAVVYVHSSGLMLMPSPPAVPSRAAQMARHGAASADVPQRNS